MIGSTVTLVGLVARAVEAQEVTAGEHTAQEQLGDSPATTGTQEPRTITPRRPGDRDGVILRLGFYLRYHSIPKTQTDRVGDFDGRLRFMQLVGQIECECQVNSVKLSSS
jgi:hypothetical protein